MIPYIHVNCAMSADGKIAGPDRKQVRISSEEDITRVKLLRKKYDAILVGIGTVIADDPHLTVKGLSKEENPVRIIVDPNGRMPDGAKVLNDLAHTIVLTATDREYPKNIDIIKIANPADLRSVLESVHSAGIRSILVEGGGETISSFFKEGLVNRYTVFIGSMIIGGRVSPTPVDGDGWITDGGVRMHLESYEKIGDGVLLTYSVSGSVPQ